MDISQKKDTEEFEIKIKTDIDSNIILFEKKITGIYQKGFKSIIEMETN